MGTDFKANPFTVRTPEMLDANEACALFVDVYSDFNIIKDVGHAIVQGPRGSGKSMMFRFLQPDCQCEYEKCDVNQLEFFAVLISIKKTSLDRTDLHLLPAGTISNLVNEHLLCMYVASQFFHFLTKLPFAKQDIGVQELLEFCNSWFPERLRIAGVSSPSVPPEDYSSAGEYFEWLETECDRLYQEAFVSALRLVTTQNSATFDGPLCGYMSFLYPMICKIRQFPFMPQKHIYLLIDDADRLNYSQTRVLNSWIAKRTTAEVSLKLSIQAGYSTFQTLSGHSIEAPHDYEDIDISEFYTTKYSRYKDRVFQMVKKRLALAKIDVSPKEFFPKYDAQEKKIDEIKTAIREGTYPLKHHSQNPNDDVLRYAIPEYFRQLAGPAKNTPKYMYAGFDQLVHLSSGVFRNFLAPAAKMVSDARGADPDQTGITSISHTIQNRVLREEAESLMQKRFNRFVSIKELNVNVDDPDFRDFETKKARLRCLLEVLGGAFHEQLVDDELSERRVFSLAFSHRPDPELLEIFELGVRAGYFQRSTIGNKEGTGRAIRYLMNRQLSPYFGLDPSGINGYLFTTNYALWHAISDPDGVLRRVKRKGAEATFDANEPNLFEKVEI